MSYSSNTPQSVSTFLAVAGGGFLLATMFDLITEFVLNEALYWVWIITTYLSLILFVAALSKTGSTYRRAQSTLNGAIALIIIYLILDAILVLGLYFAWVFLFFSMAGVIMLFAASIIRGIAFTAAHIGLNKVGRGVGNPVYVIYGWIDIVFLSIYWATTSPVDDWTLLIGTYTDIALLTLVGIMLFVSSSKVKSIQAQTMHPATPHYAPVQPTYQQPQQTYQQYQPQTETYAPQKPGPVKRFCTHCGNTVTDEDRFCENCGAKVE